MAESAALMVAVRAVVLLAGIVRRADAFATTPELTVAIAIDIPPYITDNGTGGLQVAIMRRALALRSLSFVQMPPNQLETAVQDGIADVSVGVHERPGGGYYSVDFLTYHNAAFSHADANLQLESVADLAGHPILAWEGAATDLGGEFEQMYGDDGPYINELAEFANQKEQVEAFWMQPNSVAVIDAAIFRAFTDELGQSDTEAVAHEFFDPVTDFQAEFADEATRDAFDASIKAMCASGEYDNLLKLYGIVLSMTICDSL